MTKETSEQTATEVFFNLPNHIKLRSKKAIKVLCVVGVGVWGGDGRSGATIGAPTVDLRRACPSVVVPIHLPPSTYPQHYNPQAHLCTQNEPCLDMDVLLWSYCAIRLFSMSRTTIACSAIAFVLAMELLTASRLQYNHMVDFC